MLLPANSNTATGGSGQAFDTTFARLPLQSTLRLCTLLCLCINDAGRLRNELKEVESQVADLDRDLSAIRKRMEERHNTKDEDENREKKTNQRMVGESRRDFLIRTGKITPFSKLGQSMQPSENLADAMLDAEEFSDNEEDEDDYQDEHELQPRSHRNLLKPGFDDVQATESDTAAQTVDSRPTKRRRLSKNSEVSNAGEGEDVKSKNDPSDEGYTPDEVAEDDDGDERHHPGASGSLDSSSSNDAAHRRAETGAGSANGEQNVACLQACFPAIDITELAK